MLLNQYILLKSRGYSECNHQRSKKEADETNEL